MSGLIIALIIALVYTWGGIIFCCINIGDCIAVTGKELVLSILFWAFAPIINIKKKKKREREDKERWSL